MSETRRAVVVGAGLGGLLAAGFLCKHGWRVTVFEKLGFLGGKFTQFDYEGFAVPTGAFHTLPGGVGGPIMRALGRLGLGIETHTMPVVLYLEQRRGRRIISRPMYPRLRPNVIHPGSMFWAFGMRDLMSLGRMGLWNRKVRRQALAGTPVPAETLQANIERFGVSEHAGRVLSRVMEFSSAAPADVADFSDLATIALAHGGASPCILKRGCKSIIDALVSYVRAHGGVILTLSKVARIVVEESAVRGVALADGRAYEADLVVSSVGAAGTVRLLGEHAPVSLTEKAARMLPAWGATWSARAAGSFLEHKAVGIPDDTRRIAGYIEISKAAPDLAPPGQAYLLAYQHLQSDEAVSAQLREGEAELVTRFGTLPDFEVFNVSTFRKGWPAAKMQPRIGQTGAGRFESAVQGASGLCLIGEDCRGDGLAAEMIGSAALAFDQRLGEMNR